MLPANHLAHCALPANALIIYTHTNKWVGWSLFVCTNKKVKKKKKEKKAEDYEQNNLISNLTFLEMEKKKKKKIFFYISWLDWLASQNKSWVGFQTKDKVNCLFA